MTVSNNKKMQKITTSISLIFIVFLLSPFVGFTQNMEPLDSLNTKFMLAAKEIMTSAKTCALITLDDEGLPRVRAMDPFPAESDFTVWFGTNPKSRKVAQIKKDSRVTLYYLESNSAGYVMIHGIAQIVNDRKEKEKRWKDEWESFYPNRFEDLALIKVTPEWMEVISEAHGVLGDRVTWKPSRVLFNPKG